MIAGAGAVFEEQFGWWPLLDNLLMASIALLTVITSTLVDGYYNRSCLWSKSIWIFEHGQILVPGSRVRRHDLASRISNCMVIPKRVAILTLL